MGPTHAVCCKHTKENKARIPMFERIRSESQCLLKKHKNSDVLKDKIRIPIFIKTAPEFQ